MSRVQRHEWWMLIAIVILAIATTVALSRQQDVIDNAKANLAEHKEIDERSCALAIETRIGFADTLRTIANGPLSTPGLKEELIAEAEKFERLAAMTVRLCRQD